MKESHMPKSAGSHGSWERQEMRTGGCFSFQDRKWFSVQDKEKGSLFMPQQGVAEASCHLEHS